MIPFQSVMAKGDAHGTLIWACHCDCHIPTYQGDGTIPRPPAVRAMLCEPCFAEAFMPWDEVLGKVEA